MKDPREALLWIIVRPVRTNDETMGSELLDNPRTHSAQIDIAVDVRTVRKCAKHLRGTPIQHTEVRDDEDEIGKAFDGDLGDSKGLFTDHRQMPLRHDGCRNPLIEPLFSCQEPTKFGWPEDGQ